MVAVLIAGEQLVTNLLPWQQENVYESVYENIT